MRMWQPTEVFDADETELIHQTALRVLDEVGLIVESEPILRRLADRGGRIDLDSRRVSFPTDWTEAFIAESEEFDWASVTPSVDGAGAIHSGYYLSPETNEFQPWTLPRMIRYLKVAHYLDQTTGSINYTFHLDGIPDDAQVLFFHYLAYKFTGRGAASVNDIAWCPYVLEMCQAVADHLGTSVQELFRAHVHLISPLKMGREEARIYQYFAERDVRITIGNMMAAGATAPVTVPGAIALHLAERLFINILHRAYHSDKTLEIACEMSPLDMRTAMYPYGRPEKEMYNVAMAHMARHYGARFVGHCGHSDAKRPSAEAGFQKALNAIPTLLTAGHTTIMCGELSVDEVYSPIQMIIDNEIVSALQHLVRTVEVNEESLAFEVIKQVGPGGQFLDTDHTYRHFRSEIWEPSVFSRHMMAGWQQAGSKTDVEYAADIYHDLVSREPLPVRISDELERELLKIVNNATGAQIEPVQ